MLDDKLKCFKLTKFEYPGAEFDHFYFCEDIPVEKECIFYSIG